MQHFHLFWKQHPALLYGLSLLFGFYFFIHNSLFILIPLIGLWFPLLLKSRYRLLPSIILFIVTIAYGSLRFSEPAIPEQGLTGVAYLDVESLQLKSSLFSKKWVYHCQLQSFFPFEAKGLKCTITKPFSLGDRPLANKSYRVKGTLVKDQKGQLILKTKAKEPWIPIEGSWSIAEWRYQAKVYVKKWIHSHIQEDSTAAFLAGLATGEFDDRTLMNDFSRFGLQHIMAISGFHFAIVAAILSFIFRLFIPYKISAIVIVILLSLYFLFLGISGSILRAWVMIAIAMIGLYIERSARGLNSLGIALIATFFIDPYLTLSMGFQLSFLITASILLFFTLIDQKMISLLPKRALSMMVQMDSWNQHGYVLLCFFRQALALTIAVNIIALPALLFYFHQFPLMSLLYNLFFPFLVSISMLLLILSAIIPWMHPLNNGYTSWVLQLTHEMPISIDIFWRVDDFPLSILAIVLTGIFLMGITLRKSDDGEFSYL